MIDKRLVWTVALVISARRRSLAAAVVIEVFLLCWEKYLPRAALGRAALSHELMNNGFEPIATDVQGSATGGHARGVSFCLAAS